MSKTKRGLQLGAAITSVVFSGILCISSIISIAGIVSLVSLEPELFVALPMLIAAFVFVLLFAIANIIVSAMICAKPKTGTHKGKCITALTLNAVLALLYIISGSFGYMLMPLACVGLFIAELCVKNNVEVKPAEENKQAE